MSAKTVDFIERLVAAFPYLNDLLIEHKRDNFGDILPHVFIADVARLAIAMLSSLRNAPPDNRAQIESRLRKLLDFLEASYENEGPEVEELLSVSFLEHLPRPGEGDAWGIREWVGPKMRAQLAIIG